MPLQGHLQLWITVLLVYPSEINSRLSGQGWPRLALATFHLTFRVAEPAAWARHLRFCPSANAVTRQGLGERSAATEAGNPVLYEGRLGGDSEDCHHNPGESSFAHPFDPAAVDTESLPGYV